MRVTPLLLILVLTVSTVLGRTLTSLLKQKSKLFNYDRDSDRYVIQWSYREREDKVSFC
ncbi:unnamed protein product [Nippostrongylus brasiliensis]|uniref:Secreted protein n=1 Tax=Nippostrongylus brasiliensis TaxID=27835 RepID=A0A0N4XIZ4_NIPBR|nr:unnamed protein product [Nippostrongylus brasiliensis]